MKNINTCPGCTAPIVPGDTMCGKCGCVLGFAKQDPEPVSAPQQNTQLSSPVLEVTNMKAWYAAGEHIAFSLRIHHLPEQTISVQGLFTGHLSQENQLTQFLKSPAESVYKASFQGTIPKKGGDIVLSIDITCFNQQQIKTVYHGDLIIDAISPSTNQEAMIKQRINAKILNIKNKEGLVDLESADFDQINIDTNAGLTALKTSLEQGKKILSERVELIPTSTEKLVGCKQGRLQYHSPYPVKATQVVAEEEITLGRETPENLVDIALKCFPENNENQHRISRISRKHCKIRYHRQQFEICDLSLWGTYLNDQRLQKESWHPLSDQDRIKFADINLITGEITGALNFKVTIFVDSLLLERIDNAPEEENYLIIRPETKPTYESVLNPPAIFHYQGVFHYYCETGEPHTVPLEKEIRLGDLIFSFHPESVA